MELGLSGTTVVVTGGASNIGRAIAMAFAREGSRVAIFDRDTPMAERTVEEIRSTGASAHSYTLDLTDIAETLEAAGAVETELGPITTLVNNVGWNGPAAFFLDISPDRWEQSFRANLIPTYNATRAVLPQMVERRSGSIVSISSDAGFGEAMMSDYGSMKAGVMSFTRSIAREYGRFGIRANSVCPGVVIPEQEEIGDGSLWHQDAVLGERQIAAIEKGIPLRERPEAVDIAWTVLFLASERARRLTGQVVSVSGGFQMPR